MEIKIKYGESTGVEDFTFSDSDIKGIHPVNLVVEKINDDKETAYNRALSLSLYISTFLFMFKGVSNYATGDILGMELKRIGFDNIKKENSRVSYEDDRNKDKTVIYELSSESIIEHMYIATAVSKDNILKYESDNLEDLIKTSDSSKVLWQNDLISPNQDVLRDNIINAIIATTPIPGIDFYWDEQDSDGTLKLINEEGVVLDIEDVESDEIYFLIKLIENITYKGIHNGVIFIDAENFGDTILNAILFTMQTFFKSTHVFVTHLNTKSKIKVTTVELPDFKTRKCLNNE